MLNALRDAVAESAGGRDHQDSRRDDQGPVDLRAGAPAAQGRTRPKPFEGRSWIGLHRHALMTMITYLPPIPPPQGSGTEKKNLGTTEQPSMPAVRQAILNLFARPPPLRCPHCDRRLAGTLRSKAPK